MTGRGHTASGWESGDGNAPGKGLLPPKHLPPRGRSPADGVQQAQRGVCSAHVDPVLQDELVDPLHALLAAPGGERGDPQDAAVQAVQSLQQLLPPRGVDQVFEGPLDDRRVHGHQVCLEPHVPGVLLHWRQVAPGGGKKATWALGEAASSSRYPALACPQFLLLPKQRPRASSCTQRPLLSCLLLPHILTRLLAHTGNFAAPGHVQCLPSAIQFVGEEEGGEEASCQPTR